MKKRRFTEKKSISSVFSLFLAFALMVTSVLGSSLGTLEVQAAKGTLSGSGTDNDPYIIEDAADLKAFAALLDGNAENLGIYAKVADGVASIDVSDETWQPMPANVKDTDGNDAGYTGVFDGNGATIKLNVDKSGKNAGLFSIIGDGGEVKNVTTDGNVIGGSYVGGICGTNKGTISNCNNKAEVKATQEYAGGIAGYCKGTGKLIFSGSMTNSGEIHAYSDVGGIVGRCSDNSFIRGTGELKNTGTIDAGTNNDAGGIIGKIESKKDSYVLEVTGEVQNTADIKGSQYIGGIVGKVQSSGSDQMQIMVGSILNTGDVTASGGSNGGIVGCILSNTRIATTAGDIRNTGVVKGQNNIGGVIGYASSATLTAAGNIINAGEVASTVVWGDQIGGIAGNMNDSQLIAVGGEIRNESNVTGASAVGGIAGWCNRYKLASPIRAYGDIVNQGKISTTEAKNIGGIVGSYNCNEGIVSDTGVIKNEGAIEGIDTYVGGIVGSYNIAASTGAVQKCINTGDVTASKGIQVGGLFGYVSITSSTEEYRNIENSYSTGQVNITDAKGSQNGTLVGSFSGNKIKNCYDTVTDALPVLGDTTWCKGTENCYSMSEDTSVTEPEGVVVKTKAEFASGEVAYLLDGTGESRAEAPVWGQNIGTDESPVLGGAAVYKDGDVYANTEHTYDVAYTWSADKKNCTAKQNCRLCGIEGAEETVAAAYSIKKQATEQAEGIGLYTAVFKNGLFTTQTAEVKIAKLPPKPSQPTNPSNPSNPTKPTNNKKKPAAKGTTLKDSKGATYKVTGAKVKNPTVTYVKPKKNVKKVSIPATITVKGVKYKVTAVFKDAFKNNKKVTQVTIDKNVKNIGKNAFYGCKNLKKVIIKTTKLTKKTVGKNAFKGIHKKATIKVPKKKLDAYKKILKNAGISKSVKVVKM